MSYTYPVESGASIPVVMVSPLKKTLYTPVPAPYDPIENWPVLWSDIISPARRQYEEKRRTIAHLEAVGGPYSVHYPMESERVEFSGFFKRPLSSASRWWSTSVAGRRLPSSCASPAPVPLR